MSWMTLYISGRSDFRQEVRRKLEHSSIPHMPGYMESVPGQGYADLYWLDGTVPLRKVKEQLGSKLILKHRLRFFSSLEELIGSWKHINTQEFTAREREMITEMREAS